MITNFAPFVKETTTTIGTGTYTLGGAVAGFAAFSGSIPSGGYVFYGCTDGTDFEAGFGLYNFGTISRDAIFMSSNSESNNLPIDWGSGTKTIFITVSPGLFNLISSQYYFADFNTSTNDVTGHSSFAIGSGNIINGSESMCIGHVHNITASNVIALNKVTASRIGDNLVYSNSYFDVPGDSQFQRTIGNNITEDATPSTLSCQMEPGSGTTGALLITARVLASQASGAGVGDSKGWELKALVKYVSGTPTLIGSVSSTVIAASAGASAWTASLNFADPYFVAITGEASKTIRWVADVSAVDVGY